MPKVHLLDYVAGNVRSLANAIEKLGYEVEWIKSPADVANAEKLILPGVGHFGHCLSQLAQADYLAAVRAHIEADKPFLGICVGLQALFEGSAEDPDVPGLGVMPGRLDRFDDAAKAVPHIGWNNARPTAGTALYALRPESKYYYVHSYKYPYREGELEGQGWHVATATYGGETFVGAVARRNVFATQFHPEKSGVAGLRVIRSFLNGDGVSRLGAVPPPAPAPSQVSPDANTHTHTRTNADVDADASGTASVSHNATGLTRRIIACLDVRTNDAGDLVVTKGDQYDVREKDAARGVRNLGKPVALAERYYAQGADEIAFLNITSFRDCPLADLPMLEVLRQTSRSVFVPLTVGGGIRDTVDADGTKASALEVARLYFRSGADKVSIGSDAVLAAEEYYRLGRRLFGHTAIEQISRAYGRQAVVVSVDPRRVWVPRPDATRHATVELAPAPDADTSASTTTSSSSSASAAAQQQQQQQQQQQEAGTPTATATAPPAPAPAPSPPPPPETGPNGERHAWYACTIKGGRETRDLDVVELCVAAERMGAGEILLNSIDRDGTARGFDLALVAQAKAAVRIPVVASSGAGAPAHFADVFARTAADAALGAGIFHRGEYTVAEVKGSLAERGLVVRLDEGAL